MILEKTVTLTQAALAVDARTSMKDSEYTLKLTSSSGESLMPNNGRAPLGILTQTPTPYITEGFPSVRPPERALKVSLITLNVRRSSLKPDNFDVEAVSRQRLYRWADEDGNASEQRLSIDSQAQRRSQPAALQVKPGSTYQSTCVYSLPATFPVLTSRYSRRICNGTDTRLATQSRPFVPQK